MNKRLIAFLSILLLSSSFPLISANAAAKAGVAFKKAGVPFISLTNYASLIDLAVEKGDVDAKTQDMLMEWRNSPSTWKQ